VRALVEGGALHAAERRGLSEGQRTMARRGRGIPAGPTASAWAPIRRWCAPGTALVTTAPRTAAHTKVADVALMKPAVVMPSASTGTAQMSLSGSRPAAPALVVRACPGGTETIRAMTRWLAVRRIPGSSYVSRSTPGPVRDSCERVPALLDRGRATRYRVVRYSRWSMLSVVGQWLISIWW
jgi:hypothetical protein